MSMYSAYDFPEGRPLTDDDLRMIEDAARTWDFGGWGPGQQMADVALRLVQEVRDLRQRSPGPRADAERSGPPAE